MSGSPRRRAQRAADRRADRRADRSIPADASVIIAVNVPSASYEHHVQRALGVLQRAGFECHAMTGEYILRMADDIRAEVKAATEAEALVADAALRAGASGQKNAPEDA